MALVTVPLDEGHLVVGDEEGRPTTYVVVDGVTDVPDDDLAYFLATVDGSQLEVQQP